MKLIEYGNENQLKNGLEEYIRMFEKVGNTRGKRIKGKYARQQKLSIN